MAVNNVGQSTTAGTTSLAVGQTLTMVLNATVTATTGNVTNTVVYQHHARPEPRAGDGADLGGRQR